MKIKAEGQGRYAVAVAGDYADIVESFVWKGVIPSDADARSMAGHLALTRGESPLSRALSNLATGEEVSAGEAVLSTLLAYHLAERADSAADADTAAVLLAWIASRMTR